MSTFFGTFVIGAIFLLLFDVIVGQGVVKTYIFFGLLGILSLCILIRMIYLKFDIGDIAALITLQVFYVLFMLSYCKNTEKKQLFETIIESGFISLLFTGLFGLKKEEYLKIESRLKECLGSDNAVIGKVYLFLSYNKDELIVRYIFNNKVDYEEYINRSCLIDSNIIEIEERGKGMCLVYKVPV